MGKLFLLVVIAVNVFGAFGVITITPPTNVTVMVRFPAVLRCQAMVDDIHFTTVTWSRLDGVVVDPSRYDPLEGALPFNSAQIADAGGYRCEASSGSDRGSATVWLTVTDELGFLSKPGNVQVAELGNVAVLDCNTINIAADAVSFAWFFEDGTIPLGGASDSRLTTQTGGRLVITSVIITDIGNYSCVITRTVGVITQRATSVIALNVDGYGPPDTGIGSGPEHTISIIEFTSGGNGDQELHCNIESLLTPTYVWTRLGVLIAFEATGNGVYARFGTDILIFTDANPSDTGVYNCTATNKLGTAWRAYTVKLEHEESSIWGRWWMILIYCIIFCLFLLALLILLIYVLCTGGFVLRRAATEDTKQLYENSTAFDTSAMMASLPPQTGSQTWEQKFSGEEEQLEEQQQGSQTWEHQFAADDDEEEDD